MSVTVAPDVGFLARITITAPDGNKSQRGCVFASVKPQEYLVQKNEVVQIDEWRRAATDSQRTTDGARGAALYADEAGEEELAARIGRDDHVALIFLFAMYYSRLAGVFSRLLGTWDPETIRMHIQAAAVTAWQARRSLAAAESVHAWMMGLALRQVRRSLRLAASVGGRASRDGGNSLSRTTLTSE